jgi:hypothetical protein
MDYQDKINEYLDKAKIAELEGDKETAEAYRAEAQWLSIQEDDHDLTELNTDLEVV